MDAPEKNRELGVAEELTFPIYSDPSRASISRWGVADAKREIALPATFVVDKGGTVKFRHVGDNPGDRPGMKAVLAALQH